MSEPNQGKMASSAPAELLPVIYFHSVFTLPHELNAIVLPAINFDFGMQACYIPHYFGTKDKTLSVTCSL